MFYFAWVSWLSCERTISKQIVWKFKVAEKTVRESERKRERERERERGKGGGGAGRKENLHIRKRERGGGGGERAIDR